MPTAADIVTRAFRRLGIKAEDENLSADQAAHGLDVLNSMMAQWRMDGIDYVHANMNESDPFPLGAEVVQSTVTLLAGELAPDYGVTPPWDMGQAMARLQAFYMPVFTPLEADTVLQRRSPSNGWRR